MNSVSNSRPNITVSNRAYVDRNIQRSDGSQVPVFRHGNAVDMTGRNGAIAFQNNLAITRHLPNGSSVRYEVPQAVVERFINNNPTDGNLYASIRGGSASRTSNQGNESIQFTTDGLHDQRDVVGAGATVTEIQDYVDPNNGGTQSFRILTGPNGRDITDALLASEGVSRRETPAPGATPTPAPTQQLPPFPNQAPTGFPVPQQGTPVRW